MKNGKELSLEAIIVRSPVEDVNALTKYLKKDFGLDLNMTRMGEVKSKEIADYFRELGGNDFANLYRGDGVEYSELVFDVGIKLKANVETSNSVSLNEQAILIKIFEDSLEHMSNDEKRELSSSLGIEGQDLGAIGPAVLLAIQAGGVLGGFMTYQLAVIVANMVSRALFNQGLAFAANAGLARGVGFFLGPIAWMASGAWLAYELAGPAFRKTVPAVVHIAMLRQVLTNSVSIGIVGEVSSGKDSAIRSIFDINSNISPISGSTAQLEVYKISKEKQIPDVKVVNYAGFNDIRDNVNEETFDHLAHTDVFIWVLDVMRGATKQEETSLGRLKEYGKPILACINKVDLPRDEGVRKQLVESIRKKLDLEGVEVIETAFDPDPRLAKPTVDNSAPYEWVVNTLSKIGKNIS